MSTSFTASVPDPSAVEARPSDRGLTVDLHLPDLYVSLHLSPATADRLRELLAVPGGE